MVPQVWLNGLGSWVRTRRKTNDCCLLDTRYFSFIHSPITRTMEGCDHRIVHTPCPCSSFFACLHRSVEQLSNKVTPPRNCLQRLPQEQNRDLLLRLPQSPGNSVFRHMKIRESYSPTPSFPSPTTIPSFSTFPLRTLPVRFAVINEE